MFAIVWILIWGWVFGILNDPSGWQIFGFLVIGIGGPVGTWISRSNRDR